MKQVYTKPIIKDFGAISLVAKGLCQNGSLADGSGGASCYSGNSASQGTCASGRIATGPSASCLTGSSVTRTVCSAGATVS
jgi:hypothetical protein